MQIQAYRCEGDAQAQVLHCHEEVELIAVCRGRGLLQCGRARHATGPGVLSVVCPQEPHAGTPLGSDFVVKVLNISWNWFEQAGLDWRALWHKEALCEKPLLAAFLRAHEAVWQHHSRLTQEESIVMLYSLVGTPTAVQSPGPGHRIEQSLQAIQARFAEDLSLGELAADVGLTPSYFCRVFKQTFGLPPHAYQNALRVARAKALLDTGKAPAEVAAEVGFYDQSHLSLHFKRLLGTTPAVVRRTISS